MSKSPQVLPEEKACREPSRSGVKRDANKPDMSLLSSEWMIQTAHVMSFGAKKYAAHNWRNGLAWSRCYSALQRHLTAWNAGEDADPESGLMHLAHASCCLMFLIEYAKTHPANDDRYKGEPK